MYASDVGGTVKASEMLDRGRDPRVDGSGRRDVDLREEVRRAAACALRERFQCCLQSDGIPIGDREECALRSKKLSRCFAYTRCGTRDCNLDTVSLVSNRPMCNETT